MLYKKLKKHLGHDIEIADYTDNDGKIVNLAIECKDCNEVLIDRDNPNWKQF